MEKELNQLLGEKFVDDQKAIVEYNGHSIDITLIDDDGYTGYGDKFYSATEAYEFLEANDCLGE